LNLALTLIADEIDQLYGFVPFPVFHTKLLLRYVSWFSGFKLVSFY